MAERVKILNEESVFILMRQVMHLSEYQALRRMEHLQLKLGQAGILFWLAREGELSQKKLAQKMGITPPSVTVAIRKLEERGLIEKKTDPSDQRSLRIRLTQEGSSMLEKIKGIMEDMEADIYRGFSQEEKLLLRRLLINMKENMMKVKEFEGMDICSILSRTHKQIKSDLL